MQYSTYICMYIVQTINICVSEMLCVGVLNSNEKPIYKVRTHFRLFFFYQKEKTNRTESSLTEKKKTHTHFNQITVAIRAI